MKTSTAIWVIVIIIILGGGYWYWSSTQAPAGPTGALGTNGSPNQGNLGGTDTGTPQQPSGDGTGVSQNLILGLNTDPTLGAYLSAFNGMTVYTFSKDKVGTSTCYGECAAVWPPYTVTSAADINVPSTITGTVATITRADGTLQVTYNGMPLYFYVKDTKPGDTTGQNVGKVWFVVKP